MPERRSGVRRGRAAAAITQKESEPAKKTLVGIGRGKGRPRTRIEALKLDSEKEGVGVVNLMGVAIEDLPFQEKVQAGGSISPMYKVDRKRQRLKSTKKCTASADSESHVDIQQNSNTNSDESFKHFPEDLIHVILSLVPLKCLLNSARYVSKSWATTIQSCLRGKPPGIYFENIDYKDSYFLNIQEGLQFEKIYFGIPLRMGRIIATCDGIFLLCDCYHLRLTFAVNPILKCFFRIPPLDTSLRITIQYQSTIAYVPCSTKFKLFLVDVKNVSGVNCYVFYVLRIGIDNTWKEIARKEVILRVTYFLSGPICSGDNDIYWMTLDGVIVMDVDHETIIKEYPLPPPLRGNEYWLTGKFLWLGDRLSYIDVVDEDGYMEDFTYEVYTLNLDSGNWTLYLEMGPFDFAACDNEFDINLWSGYVDFRFWINDQIFFEVVFSTRRARTRLRCFKRGHFCYNVKTRQLTKINGIAEDKFKAWLHTNTLVSLPSTPT